MGPGRGRTASGKTRSRRSVCRSSLHLLSLRLVFGEQVELAGDLVGSPGEGGVVDAAGEFGLMGDLDQLGVVDAAGLWRRSGGFGSGFGMGMPSDVVWDRQSHRHAGQTDLDAG